jgi:osomolarity two-component system sensor histidine kinase NIK1
LSPFIVHQVNEVANKERCPHIDAIVVDSLSLRVVGPSLILFLRYSDVFQTESIREYGHLGYIPIVLLVLSMPRLNRTYLFVP